MKNKSAKNMVQELNLFTPKISSSHLLYDEIIFVIYLLLDMQFCISFKGGNLNLYAFSFTIRSLWSRQTNAFDKVLPLSIDLFHFSSIAKRHCCVLKPSGKPD